MTDGPLKSNSTMCGCGQGRRGSWGSTPPPPPPGAFGLAASQSGSRGRGAPLAFRLLRLFSLLRVSEWVERSWRRWALLPQAQRDLLGLEQAAAPPFLLNLHGALIQDIFFSKLQPPPWILVFSVDFCVLLQPCWVQFGLDLDLMANIWVWLANRQSCSMWGRCLWGRKLQEARWVWCCAAGSRRISPWNW